MTPRASRAKPAERPAPAASMAEEVRKAFLAAFETMGGPKSLAGWGKENPNQFYAMFLKLIPEADLRGVPAADVSEAPLSPLSEGEWSSRAGG